jgi:TonB family protein
MKKIVLLCLFLYVANITVFAQYKVKPTEPSSRAKTPLDNTELALQSNTSVVAKKDSTISKSTKVSKQTPKVVEKSVNSDEDEGVSEEELAEIDALIAKAKNSLNSPRNDQSSQKAFEGLSPMKVVTPPAVQVVTAQPSTVVAQSKVSVVEKAPVVEKVPEPAKHDDEIATNGAALAPREVALTEEEKKLFGGSKALKFNIPTDDMIDFDSVYVAPETQPSFQGGAEALKQYFGQNLQFPQKYIDTELKGKVYVRFIVRRNGKIDKLHLVKGPNDECNQEALRVIKAMPNWIPATNKGNVVSSYHVLPVSFLIKKN